MTGAMTGALHGGDDERGGKAPNGAGGLWGHPKALHPDSSPAGWQLPWQDGSSPETHHNLSLHRVGVFKPNSEAVTKCHLH